MSVRRFEAKYFRNRFFWSSFFLKAKLLYNQVRSNIFLLCLTPSKVYTQNALTQCNRVGNYLTRIILSYFNNIVFVYVKTFVFFYIIFYNCLFLNHQLIEVFNENTKLMEFLILPEKIMSPPKFFLVFFVVNIPLYELSALIFKKNFEPYSIIGVNDNQ